jgi:hypothetical protein
MIPWINMGPPPTDIDVGKAEALYAERSGGAVRFIGSLTVPARNGVWTERPAHVFWQEKPEKPEYSHYFGLFSGVRHGSDGDSVTVYICDGRSVAEGDWDGMMADDGEIIFSRYRHDYRTSRDGSAMVDGGRDYFKCRGAAPVKLRVVRDKMEIVT